MVGAGSSRLMALAAFALRQVDLVGQPMANLRHLQHLGLRPRIVRLAFDFQAASGELPVSLRTAHRRLVGFGVAWNQRSKVGAVPGQSASSAGPVSARST